ncbi:MAG: 16S rRNA (guanine(527)-N(7))-methyltransferase RsmG [Peptoniphilaceae bacterium]|nr:16S rRNA (guanine(527)-N(7))-methyltransferase RsmG [Peptoniphilaceae bacterium]
MTRLQEKAQRHGLTLTDAMISQFQRYQRMLIDWNEHMDLTAITDPEEIEDKHFLDSLSVLRLIPHLEGRWVDVGSGAGFPGIPLAIAVPELDITLVDSLLKRIRFLEAVIEDLKLPNVKAVHARSDELFREGEPWRESFDGAVSRAVAPLSTLLEYVLPGVRVGGVFIAMKGSAADEECATGENAITILGGKLETIDRYQKDESHFERANLLIRKVVPTPGRYPRRGDKARKRPL